MKAIIFCSEPKFLWFFKRFTVYIRSSFSTNKNTTPVKDDIFSASDYRYCDHLASCIESELIERVINTHSIDFLAKWGGDTYAQYFIGDSVIEHARNVYESFNYASKVKSKYNIKEDVYIFPLNFSLRIYKEMEKMKLIPQNIRIHFLAKSYIKLHNIVKFLYFFIRMLAYPEIIALKAKNQNNFKKYNYKSCAYLDDGLLGEVSNDNKIFSLFDNQETLYIDDRFRKFQLWPKKVRKIGMHVLRLEDVIKEISIIKYLKQFYKSAFKWRFNMVWLAINYPFLIKNCSRATRERILWEIFYDKFNIENAVRMMVKENLTSSIVHKKNNTKTTFVYFSITEEIVEKVKNKGASTCHDYTHMIFDTVVSSQVSNDWFKTLENCVDAYVEIGPIFSDLVLIAKNDRNEICKKMGLNSNQIIISFLDHTVGYQGVMTFDAYKQFMDGMLKLAKQNIDIHFLFKSKKDISIMKSRMGEGFSKIAEELEKMPNCVYANEFDLTSFDVIGVSDLVVSAPMSSVIFEALCGGVRTVSFDSIDQYVDYNTITKKFPKLNAVNYDELENLVNYWVYKCTDKDFDAFLDNHIRPNVDQKFCKISMIDRFKEVLHM